MSSSARDGSTDADAEVRGDPIIPERELLIILFRNKQRPWRGAVNVRTETGAHLVIVSARRPGEILKLYRGVPSYIWLDRSTAHEARDGIVVVNPTNLSSVLDEIRTLGRKGGIVVFEGFEDILAANELDRVIRFLNMLGQTCRSHSLSAIVPVPYRAVPQRSRNQLTEAFESMVVG